MTEDLLRQLPCGGGRERRLREPPTFARRRSAIMRGRERSTDCSSGALPHSRRRRAIATSANRHEASLERQDVGVDAASPRSTARSGQRRATAAGPQCCLRHDALVRDPRSPHARGGRRPGAQDETPASRQRSCLGAPVRKSARCSLGRRAGAQGETPASQQGSCLGAPVRPSGRSSDGRRPAAGAVTAAACC
jgi:hypothetical protein